MRTLQLRSIMCSVAAALLLVPAAAAAQAEQDAVLGTIDQFFAAMASQDTVALDSILVRDGRFTAVSVEDGDVVLSGFSHAEFIALIASSEDELVERMWDPQVLIDGPLAAVWTPYDFHRGDAFSHCGTDIFMLVKHEQRWKITGGSFTRVRTGCAPRAQEPAQQVVPLELVQALTLNFSYNTQPPQVLVGSVPDVTASVVPIPADARIIGSFVFASNTRSALALAAEPDIVRRELERAMIAAGWEQFRPPQRSGFAPTTFREAMQFCMGDSATVSFAVGAAPAGGSTVMIMHMRDQDSSICRMEPPVRYDRHESLVPALSPPAGARSLGGSSGGSGVDYWSARTRLRTTASPEELVTHYDAQLRAHDWTPQARTTVDGLALATYRLTDADGAAWDAMLTAFAPAPDADRIVTLLLTKTEVRQ